MKKSINTVLIVVFFIIISVVFFIIQTILFKNQRESLFLIFQDMIFLPFNIIFITILLGQIVGRRGKQVRLSKLNILINEFFSEVGNSIILSFNAYVTNIDDFANLLDFSDNFTVKQFDKVIKMVPSASIIVKIQNNGLDDLLASLENSKSLLIRMLENQNILEHDEFTEMLIAVHHVLDELRNRDDLNLLTAKDANHLSYDILRAYPLLIKQWVLHMKNLKNDYPYMFSLILRKNLFGLSKISY